MCPTFTTDIAIDRPSTQSWRDPCGAKARKLVARSARLDHGRPTLQRGRCGNAPERVERERTLTGQGTVPARSHRVRPGRGLLVAAGAIGAVPTRRVIARAAASRSGGFHARLLAVGPGRFSSAGLVTSLACTHMRDARGASERSWSRGAEQRLEVRCAGCPAPDPNFRSFGADDRGVFSALASRVTRR
jgi:hypothetical protein